MSGMKDFSGTVVRIESDGFGIIKFDDLVGANSHGVFSTSISEKIPRNIKRGSHVSGTAEVDDSDLAAIKNFSVI